MLINRGSIIDREGWEWRLDTDRTMTDEDSESDVNSCLFVGKDSEADGVRSPALDEPQRESMFTVLQFLGLQRLKTENDFFFSDLRD